MKGHRAQSSEVERRALAMLASTLLAAFASSCAQSRTDSPDIVVIVIDTARADRYPPAREHAATPIFRELADEGIVFERAYSTSSWTVPAHASLFTGLLPISHQAAQETQRLAERHRTLAEILGEAGYDTAAFSNNPWVSGKTGLLQGFSETREMWWASPPDSPGGLPHPTNKAISDWLSTRDPERPLLLFVNYIEPHWPYRAPPRYVSRFFSAGEPYQTLREANFSIMDWYLNPEAFAPGVLSVRRKLYDAEIAYTDALLADLRRTLERADAWNRSLVVVTADHGENLGEKGHQGHLFALYDSTIRVPLLIRPPGGRARGEVRRDPVQLVDVFATVLSAAGLHVSDARVAGLDLLSTRVPEHRPLVAEYYYPSQALESFPDTPQARRAVAPYQRSIRSLQIGHEKLIWASDGRHEFFDLAADPAETTNLADRNPERKESFVRRLESLLEPLRSDAVPGSGPSRLDADTREKLRSLGYLR